MSLGIEVSYTGREQNDGRACYIAWKLWEFWELWELEAETQLVIKIAKGHTTVA